MDMFQVYLKQQAQFKDRQNEFNANRKKKIVSLLQKNPANSVCCVHPSTSLCCLTTYAELMEEKQIFIYNKGNELEKYVWVQNGLDAVKEEVMCRTHHCAIILGNCNTTSFFYRCSSYFLANPLPLSCLYHYDSSC